MAGIDLGGGQGRAVNRDINMIPFIDLLMVTIAFLLITAVWVTHSRVEADARVPSDRGEIVPEAVAVHVYAEPEWFRVAWKRGRTVIAERTVPRAAAGEPERALEAALGEGWKRHGVHTDPSDRMQDRAVLHTADDERFAAMVAMMDAVAATTRDAFVGGEARRVPALRLALAE